MKATDDEKLKAAYALNLLTVSVSQIIDYNDINIMKQEYNTIINNLNLENMPKDETLLDIIKQIMDTISSYLIEDGDRKIIEMQYQQQIKNAIWNAVPNVGAIFATANPVALAMTLATQVGIGYMNYRRNKADYEQKYASEEWALNRNRINMLNGLQQQLFETSWRLADKYSFPDKYRLTQQQITEYNRLLLEPNPIKRYNNLCVIAKNFDAYPPFLYQIGSTANYIYRNNFFDSIETKARYRAEAITYFEKYEQLNQFSLLRTDMLTASWALEYIELRDMSQCNNAIRAKELIKIAEKNAEHALDTLELCAFAYLRIGDYDNATRVFHSLVNNNYNEVINTQILSALYINAMYNGTAKQRNDAKFGYEQLPHIANKEYILELPPKGADFSYLEWKQDKTLEESIKKIEDTKNKNRLENEAKEKAKNFYRKPILIVHRPHRADVAEYFLTILTDNRNKLGDSALLYPTKCELKDYIKNRADIEKKGTHVILVGDSEEAKNFYKHVKNGRWDYYKAGMRFVSQGNKTVLLSRKLKNKEINELLHIANEVRQKHTIKMPSNVESIEYEFLKEVFDGFTFHSVEDAITSIIAGLILSPLIVLGQALENILNAGQFVINQTNQKKLNFLQYCVAIYKYLERENALVESINDESSD